MLTLSIKYNFECKCWKHERRKKNINGAFFCVEIKKNERLNQSGFFFVFILNLIISYVRLSNLNLTGGNESNIYNIPTRFRVINFVFTPRWAMCAYAYYSARSILLSVCLSMEIPWYSLLDLCFNVHLLILNPWTSNSTLNSGKNIIQIS